MFGLRRGLAEVAERQKEIEIRLSRLAEAVQSAMEVAREAGRKADNLEAREAARIAGLHEATDKLNRVVERARKTPRARDVEADDSDYDWLAALGKPAARAEGD